MQRVIMKSDIHRATVTLAEVGFAGSCGVAPELRRASETVFGARGMGNAAWSYVDAHRSAHERAAIA